MHYVCEESKSPRSQLSKEGQLDLAEESSSILTDWESQVFNLFRVVIKVMDTTLDSAYGCCNGSRYGDFNNHKHCYNWRILLDERRKTLHLTLIG